MSTIVSENLKSEGVVDYSTLISRDNSIEGFSTAISVQAGESIHFKINCRSSYNILIYRLGYYQGKGARKVGEIKNIAGGIQPQCEPNSEYPDLVDCGCWEISAEWKVPHNMISGIYLAYLSSLNNDAANHILFIVRDDKAKCDVLFKTSDTTWQAYNRYRNRCFYPPNSKLSEKGQIVRKVSYNRPITQSSSEQDYFFYFEYRMLRWLERNGYAVKYCSANDIAKIGASIDTVKESAKRYKILLSVGHDEYWAFEERQYFEVARDNGTHLAFFSGNECYWKTRWEDEMRTLVCYKEGNDGDNETDGDNSCHEKCDPLPGSWTGLWRNNKNQKGEVTPECMLSGQLSWVITNPTHTINVPRKYRKLPFWRNTPISELDNENESLLKGLLGYEWNYFQDNFSRFYPAELKNEIEMGRLSEVSLDIDKPGKPKNITHYLTLFKRNNTLTFAAGTTNWALGLDNLKPLNNNNSDTDLNVQQSTVNLFFDMGKVIGLSLQENIKDPKP